MPSSSGRLMARAPARLKVERVDPNAFSARASSPERSALNNALGSTRSTSGFTLLEILVTLALIALLAGALIAGAGRLMNEGPTTPAEIFRKALTEARQYAVEKNVEVRLSFDAKERAFIASTMDSTRNYPTNAAGDLVIDFLAAQKGGNAALIAGVLVETQSLPFVTFYPDGTCSPFRVQFRLNGSASITAIDPWTCAPVLEAGKS